MRVIGVMFLMVFSLYGASYVTTTDNENNAHTGVADNDMGSGYCVYNNDAIHPVEFNIDMTGAQPQSNAYLAVFIEDVDWPDEQDEVFLNGHSLGFATGQNELDNSTLFIISDLSWIKSGNNLVEIYVDQENDGWCAITVSGELLIDENLGSGPATIRTLTTDTNAYDYGDTVNYTVEIDTTSATPQHTRVEITLRDTNGKIIDFDTSTALRDRTVDDSVDDPYSGSFVLPTSGVDGLWSVVVAVYDLESSDLNKFKSLTFAVPQAAVLTPTISSVTPSSAEPGDALLIIGTNFDPNNTQCSIDGIALTNMVIVNSTNITGNVDPNVNVGSHTLTCTTGAGTATHAITITGTPPPLPTTAVPLSPLGKMMLLLGIGLIGLFSLRTRAV